MRKKVLSNKNLPVSVNDKAREPKEDVFSVFHIPVEIYKEVGEKFGQGEEKEILINSLSYKTTILDPKKAAFEGALGLHVYERNDGTIKSVLLFLWSHISKEKERVQDPEIFRIMADTKQTNHWEKGKGYLYQCLLNAHFQMGGLLITAPESALISLMLFRANEITKDSRFRPQSFWDVQLDPEMKYDQRY